MGSVKLWDMADARTWERRVHGHADAVYAVSWSADDRRLASASLDHSIRLWDAETGREIATLRGHTNWVEALSWSPDDRRLASGSHDGTIKLWDAGTGREIRTIPEWRRLPVLAVSWSARTVAGSPVPTSGRGRRSGTRIPARRPPR